MNPDLNTKWHQQWKEMACACGDKYFLGKTGTIFGCDRCHGITRNPVDGTIIPDPFEKVFATEEEGEQS